MGVRNKEVLEQFSKTLRTWHNVSKEHRDYILIKELYHCTQSELDEQDENILNLHYEMLMREREREHIENERAKQKAKSNSNHKTI